jgi:hypothetical protein
MRAKSRLKCPILIEADGRIARSELFASDKDLPADITIKIRDVGWKPYRIRFDEAQTAWIVSAMDWLPTIRRANP